MNSRVVAREAAHAVPVALTFVLGSFAVATVLGAVWVTAQVGGGAGAAAIGWAVGAATALWGKRLVVRGYNRLRGEDHA